VNQDLFKGVVLPPSRSTPPLNRTIRLGGLYEIN